MKKRLKRIRNILIILVIIAVLGGVAYYRFKEKIKIGKGDIPEKIDMTIPVVVYSAKVDSISETLLLSGSIVPVKEVNIFSTVPGKIKSIKIKEGERVKKDDTLAYIDRDQAGFKFKEATVNSTIDGIVKKILTEEGDSVAPTSPLFQIIDMDFVEVVVNIPEREIQKVKNGLKAKVTVVAYPNKTFSGRINKLSPVVDFTSRTLEARILVKNSNHILKPGMFGKAQILIKERKDAIVIPLSSIIEKNDEAIIYIVKDGKAYKVNPVIDIIEGEKVSVKNGIKPGDKVIVVGQHNVYEGDKITIAEEVE